MDGITSFGGMSPIRYAMQEAGLETGPVSNPGPQRHEPTEHALVENQVLYPENFESTMDMPGNMPNADAQLDELLQFYDLQPSDVYTTTARHVSADVTESSGANSGNRLNEFSGVERAAQRDIRPAAAPSSANPCVIGPGRGKKRGGKKVQAGRPKRPRARSDYAQIRAAIAAANAGRYAAIIAAGAETCAAAKAATEKFAWNLRSHLRNFIAEGDSGLGLEIIGLHNMGGQQRCEARRIRLTIEQATEHSPIETTAELIDPDRSGSAIHKLTSTYEIPKAVKDRQKLYGRVLFRAAWAARALRRSSPDQPAASEWNLTVADLGKVTSLSGMTDEQLIRRMQSFKPILGNGAGSCIARDEVTNRLMLFQAWLEVCATEINVVEKMCLGEKAPAYVMSVSGLAGRKDQPMPADSDANGLHCRFSSKPNGDIELLVFTNPTGKRMEVLGGAVLPKKTSHMTDGVKTSMLITWAVIVIKMLMKGEIPPGDFAKANAIRELQAQMICSAEWEAFRDADLAMAFHDFIPLTEAPVPKPAAVPNDSRHSAIVSVDWREIARRAQVSHDPILARLASTPR